MQPIVRQIREAVKQPLAVDASADRDRTESLLSLRDHADAAKSAQFAAFDCNSRHG
jgi:hypothetical protein